MQVARKEHCHFLDILQQFSRSWSFYKWNLSDLALPIVTNWNYFYWTILNLYFTARKSQTNLPKHYHLQCLRLSRCKIRKPHLEWPTVVTWPVVKCRSSRYRYYRSAGCANDCTVDLHFRNKDTRTKVAQLRCSTVQKREIITESNESGAQTGACNRRWQCGRRIKRSLEAAFLRIWTFYHIQHAFFGNPQNTGLAAAEESEAGES